MENINKILEMNVDGEFLQADGFDGAIIGYEQSTDKLIYDINEMVNILMDEGLSYEESLEFLDFNVLNCFMGEKTPIFVHTIDRG